MGTIPTSLWYYLYDSVHLPRSESITFNLRTAFKQTQLQPTPIKNKLSLSLPEQNDPSPILAAAKVETCTKAQENVQVPVVEPPKDIKGKRTARILVKPLRKRFSQRIIARGGPSRPKPKKVEVIDLVSDDEEEKHAKAAEEEEEYPEESVEPEETPSSCSLLSPFRATPELAPGEYDDPHDWNFHGDLYQWGTDTLRSRQVHRIVKVIPR
ncbi:hypothetical protein PIB30_029835 [Stylosanthes scabra]|uniref:Uncharacterized protein n=1 Tax=Stylosanthes scabra TaxID=79078 RepID=A0ABU6WB57_9FABA|nr:hypothetical protein [Stylosanthes scabra]